MLLSQAKEKFKLALRQLNSNDLMRHTIQLAHRKLSELDLHWDVFALPIDPPSTVDPGLGNMVFDSAKRIGDDGHITSEVTVVFFDDSMAGWSYIVIE